MVQDSDHCSSRHQIYFLVKLVYFFAKSDTIFFSCIGQGFRLQFWDLCILSNPFPDYKPKKSEFFETGHLCTISVFRKNRRRPISKKIRKTMQKLEIRRRCGPTPVARGVSWAKAPQLAARPKQGLQSPWDLL